MEVEKRKSLLERLRRFYSNFLKVGRLLSRRIYGGRGDFMFKNHIEVYKKVVILSQAVRVEYESNHREATYRGRNKRPETSCCYKVILNKNTNKLTRRNYG